MYDDSWTTPAVRWLFSTIPLCMLLDDHDLRDDWTLLGELFRDAPGRPSYQVGIRYLLVTDPVELFASYGSRLGESGDTWFAKFGARIQTWKLF